MQWEESGVAPQVIFEILSPSHRFGDVVSMFLFYEAHGVQEFYLYDPGRGDLAGWLRGDTRLEEIVEMNGTKAPA